MGKKPLKRDYLTLKEIARLYGVDRESVYQRIFGRTIRGKQTVKPRNIPYHRIGNLIVLKRKDLPKLGYKRNHSKIPKAKT